jgi:hypothetical protein
MRTAKDVVAYLEAELAEAYKIHNEEKVKENKAKAYNSLVIIVMLEEYLKEIKCKMQEVK